MGILFYIFNIFKRIDSRSKNVIALVLSVSMVMVIPAQAVFSADAYSAADANSTAEAYSAADVDNVLAADNKQVSTYFKYPDSFNETDEYINKLVSDRELGKFFYNDGKDYFLFSMDVSLNQDGTDQDASLWIYYWSSTYIEIPDEIAGYPIRDFCFYNPETLSPEEGGADTKIQKPDSFKGIYIPEKIKIGKNFVGSDVGQYHFSNSFGTIKEITVSVDNPYVKAVNSVLYSKDGKYLLYYPSGLDYETFSCPRGVQAVAAYAFFNCNDLKKLILTKTVTRVSRNAFANTANLKNIIYNAGKSKVKQTGYLNNENFMAKPNEWEAALTPGQDQMEYRTFEASGSNVMYVTNCSADDAGSVTIPGKADDKTIDVLMLGRLSGVKKLILPDSIKTVMFVNKNSDRDAAVTFNYRLQDNCIESITGGIGFDGKCINPDNLKDYESIKKAVETGIGADFKLEHAELNSLKEVTVPENCDNTVVYKGAVYNKNRTHLLAYPRKSVRKTCELHPFTDYIDDGAFKYVTKLKKIVFSKGLKSNGSGCPALFARSVFK